MVIYVDLVFLLNLLIDFLLLTSVCIILTRIISIKKIVLGSFIGSLSTFLLFIDINSLILKLILGLIMVLMTFGYHNLKYTLNNLFYLYSLSFSLGGIMYLLIDKAYYNYFLLVIGTVIVLYLYTKMMKKYQESYTNYYKVEIVIHDKNYIVTGYLDTGNKLYDSYHRPVIILNKKIKYQLNDIVYVPYITINNTSVMKCIKVDKIIINKHIFNNYLVGLTNKKINIDGISCILHSEMKGMI